MNESALIKHIVLVGDHLPLMMSAAILSSQLTAQPVRISAVEIKGKATSLVECSGSEFMPLCDILKLSFSTVLQQCQGSFSLGQRYINQQREWFVPYGQYGIQTANSEFVQGVFRLAQHNPAIQLESVCVAAQAALQGKFAIPPTSRPDLHQALAFAVNLDADSYAQQLKQFAIGHNVTFIQAENVGFTRDKNQYISSIKIDDKQTISADFWIDCSGDLACLAAQEDGVTAKSNSSDWYQRAEYIIEDVDSVDRPYNCLGTTPWGWLKTIPLAGRVCVQLEYSSEQVNEDQINQWLSDHLSLSNAQTKLIVHRKYHPKVRVNAWQGNCLLVGDAAVDMGKLLFSELYFVQAALIQFLSIYPSMINQTISANAFNQQWQQYVDEADEYVEYHCWLLDQPSEPIEPTQSAMLQQRLALFQRLGRLSTANTDAVSDNAWYGLLAGSGIKPQLTSLYLSNLSDEQLNQSFNQIESSIDKLVTGMPCYRDFYQQFNRS